ncbi:MAG: rhomboid family intramembrane serine protease [Solirubrobacteraceae bacterium]
MSTTVPNQRPRPPVRRGQTQLEGLAVLAGVVVLMWFIEAINTLDGNHLDSDGILPRSIDHVWGIFTAPFIHASWQHLIANTVPFVFMGVIIALQGAKRFALVTVIVIVVGGIGTWLVSPAHTSAGVPIYTIGASGVVFGYATYLFTRGFFNRNILELLIGLVVGVIWGGALYSSVVPHTGVSWQGHVCGAIGGVVAAYLLRNEHRGTAPAPREARALRLDS